MDTKYARPVAASIQSLLATWEGPEPPHVTVFDCGLSRDDIVKLRESFGSGIEIIGFDYSDLAALPAPMHFGSAAAYARLLIDELLPADDGKALYLDCDTLVVRSIHDFPEIHLEGLPFGAVLEVNAPLVGNRRALRGYERVGLNPGQRYFNSGVLLIDRAAWRGEGVGKRGVAFVQEHQEWLRYPDQDALNAVAAERIHALDPGWNCGTAWDDPEHPAYNWFGDVPARARVLHFVGPNKPWQPGYPNPSTVRRYEQALGATAFA